MSWVRVPGPAWRNQGSGRRRFIAANGDYCKAMTVACPHCFAPPASSCVGLENEPNNFHVVRLDAWFKVWA